MLGSNPLTAGQCATLACLWEVAAPKPGNVHRGADFDNLTLEDFLISAVAIGPAMDKAVERGVGTTVLDAITSTQAAVRTNTNLGLVLLLAPLAAVPESTELRCGVAKVLDELDTHDSASVYSAIRLANSGSIGSVEEMDITETPPDDLMQAMSIAANRDFIAHLYVNRFAELFEIVVPWFLETEAKGVGIREAIVHTHVRLMATYPDSLISRKCGSAVARQAATFAQMVLDAGQIGEVAYHEAMADLDFWLRSDHHKRNPGTTADVIGAMLYVLIREGKLPEMPN